MDEFQALFRPAEYRIEYLQKHKIRPSEKGAQMAMSHAVSSLTLSAEEIIPFLAEEGNKERLLAVLSYLRENYQDKTRLTTIEKIYAEFL